MQISEYPLTNMSGRTRMTELTENLEFEFGLAVESVTARFIVGLSPTTKPEEQIASPKLVTLGSVWLKSSHSLRSAHSPNFGSKPCE